MSFRLARMANILDEQHKVLAHDDDDRFVPTTPDTEWLSVLGADDPPWIVISGDGRILKNKAERQVLQEANLTFFCMSKPWTQMTIHEYAWKFIKVWPDIVENALASVHTPRIFEVSGGKGLKVMEIRKTKDLV